MQKNKLTLWICFVLALMLTAVLCTACMDSTLLEDNIKERMTGEGYTVKNVQNAKAVDGHLDIGSDGKPVARILSTLYCYRTQLNEDGTVAQDENGKILIESEAWVFYCASEDAADWSENSCTAYKDVDEITGRIVYRHNTVVVYGDYTAVSKVRDY